MALLSLFRSTGTLLRGEPSTHGASHRPRAGLKIEPAASGADGNLPDLRYCAIVSKGNQQPLDESLEVAAWKALEDQMALVPAGPAALANTVPVVTSSGVTLGGGCVQENVATMYVDRCAVTNADFAQFVASGGYSRSDLWPAEILPFVLQFVDSTGCPGPRFWVDGKPPVKKRNHPVVGVSWVEANAFACWAGKRLPSPAQWQRAGTWSGSRPGSEAKYPWGNAFDSRRANTWSSQNGDTVPVDHYYDGCTPNGIYQLIGNVWEWVAGKFDCGGQTEDFNVLFEQPLMELRGGAFDTYFETQATCQFRTGQPLLFRGANVGFRCCVRADQLRPPPNPSAFHSDL